MEIYLHIMLFLNSLLARLSTLRLLFSPAILPLVRSSVLAIFSMTPLTLQPSACLSIVWSARLSMIEAHALL